MQLRFEGSGQGETTYTVSELGRLVAGAVETALPDEVWVRGEVQSLSRSKAGHTYFELVEKQAGDRWPRGRLNVTLLAQERDWIRAQLADVPDFRIDNGLELRIRGRMGYHPGMGRLSLVMTAVDPIFTVGVIASHRDKVLRRLAAEHVLERNARVELPPVPLLVGLVTSVESAAYNDFVRELQESGLGFRVVVVDTRVQGQHAALGVVRALRTLRTYGVDVIAVVRGGGSMADLAAFDDERVARAIAALDVAVLTGIGHEVDTSVADRAAHTCCKTPTAVADFLVDRVRGYESRMEGAWSAVAARAQRFLDRRGGELDRAGHRIAACATHGVRIHERRLAEAGRAVSGPRLRSVLDRQHDRVDRAVPRLQLAAARVPAASARHLDGVEARLRLLDPAVTMRRGWSITRGRDGTVVRSVADVAVGDPIVTVLADGEVHSEVTRP